MPQKALTTSGHAGRTDAQPSLIARIRKTPHIQSGQHRVGTSASVDHGTLTAPGIEALTDTVPVSGPALLGQLLAAAKAHARERERLLKEKQVLAIVVRSRAAVRNDISLGLFPAPIKIGPKSSAWRESEVMSWVEATTILSRVAEPGFDMREFVAALMASRVPT
jgi:predicted DNA-binding transcriptional regulator AlpA